MFRLFNSGKLDKVVLFWMGLTSALVTFYPTPSYGQNSQNSFYNPIPITANTTVDDRLTVGDMPTGEGGFARDYRINLQAGDQVSIDLRSDEFDTMVMLIGDDGTTIVANDDSTEGGTNSLAFARITESGDYIVRVRTYAATGGGAFSLAVTRLQPVP
jgi:hypothetical protein